MSDDVKNTPAKAALLHAGYKLLIERDGDMSQVKMQEVVNRADLTSGAFYNVWPRGLMAFQESLLKFALDEGHVSYLLQLLADLEGARPDVMPLSEVARQFGAADAAHLQQDAGFRVQVALWARHGSDPAVADGLQASYQKLQGIYVQVYDKVLEAYGRTWREPFDSRSFATLLTALAEGIALRNGVDPASVPSELSSREESDTRTWELFGLATALLIGVATRPGSGDDESVWTQIAALDSSST